MSQSLSTTSKPLSYVFTITFIGIFFFIFGFVTWLNSILVPYLKIACELNNFEAYFVAFAFFISYFVMALPSSWILKKTGFKNGMIIGLLIMAAGALLFVPAASTREYGIFLSGLFVMGTGLAILQTAANPYATVIGNKESAAKRIAIMGICNKVAGGLSPLILGAIVLNDSDSLIEQLKALDALQKVNMLDELSSRVILPYIIMAIILVVMAVVTRFVPLPEIDTDTEDQETAKSNMGKTNIFQFPQLVLGVAAIFLYVGVEVMAGDTIINYGVSQSMTLSAAKIFPSYTLAAMIIGYILGIITIPKIIKQETSLMISSITGLIFAAIAMLTNGFISVMFIALLGFANAMMWPAIWPLALNGLGRFTKTGSSFLIMAIAGGALIPLLYGRLADLWNPQSAYCIMIPCYLFLLYYALSGHKLKKW